MRCIRVEASGFWAEASGIYAVTAGRSQDRWPLQVPTTG